MFPRMKNMFFESGKISMSFPTFSCTKSNKIFYLRTCPSTFDETQMFTGDPEKAKILKVILLTLILHVSSFARKSVQF